MKLRRLRSQRQSCRQASSAVGPTSRSRLQAGSLRKPLGTNKVVAKVPKKDAACDIKEKKGNGGSSSSSAESTVQVNTRRSRSRSSCTIPGHPPDQIKTVRVLRSRNLNAAVSASSLDALKVRNVNLVSKPKEGKRQSDNVCQSDSVSNTCVKIPAQPVRPSAERNIAEDLKKRKCKVSRDTTELKIQEEAESNQGSAINLNDDSNIQTVLPKSDPEPIPESIVSTEKIDSAKVHPIGEGRDDVSREDSLVTKKTVPVTSECETTELASECQELKMSIVDGSTTVQYPISVVTSSFPTNLRDYVDDLSYEDFDMFPDEYCPNGMGLGNIDFCSNNGFMPIPVHLNASTPVAAESVSGVNKTRSFDQAAEMMTNPPPADAQQPSENQSGISEDKLNGNLCVTNFYVQGTGCWSSSSSYVGNSVSDGQGSSQFCTVSTSSVVQEVEYSQYLSSTSSGSMPSQSADVARTHFERRVDIYNTCLEVPSENQEEEIENNNSELVADAGAPGQYNDSANLIASCQNSILIPTANYQNYYTSSK